MGAGKWKFFQGGGLYGQVGELGVVQDVLQISVQRCVFQVGTLLDQKAKNTTV